MNTRTCVAVIGAALTISLAACSSADDDLASSVTADQATTTEAEATTTEATDPPETTAAPECDDGDERGRYEGHSVCEDGEWVADPIERPTTTAAPTTTLPPTTTIPERDGSRANPFDLRPDAPGGPDLVSTDALSVLIVNGVVPTDPALVRQANQFNDEPPAGQHYVQATYTVGIDPTWTETVTGYDVAYICSLVGDKSKVYDTSFVSDGDGVLNLITDQPDAIGGGTISGNVLYQVDVDDTNLMVKCGDSFLIPAP